MRIGGSRTEKERAILWCLSKSPEGLYGKDLCWLTGIGRATIYIYLGRLEEDGKVRMVRDSGPYPQRYKIHLVTQS